MKISLNGLARATGTPLATWATWKRKGLLPLPWDAAGGLALEPEHVLAIALTLTQAVRGARGRALGDIFSIVIATLEAAKARGHNWGAWAILKPTGELTTLIAREAPTLQNRLLRIVDISGALEAIRGQMAAGGDPEKTLRAAVDDGMAALTMPISRKLLGEPSGVAWRSAAGGPGVGPSL